MKKTPTTVICLCLLAIVCGWTLMPAQSPHAVQLQQTAPIKFHKMRDAVAGQYIVKLNDSIARSEIASLSSHLSNSYGGSMEYVYEDVFKGFSVRQMSEQQAIALSRRPEVSSVEESARVIITG